MRDCRTTHFDALYILNYMCFFDQMKMVAPYYNRGEKQYQADDRQRQRALDI